MARKKNAGIESPDLKYRNKGMYWQTSELNRRAYNRYLDQMLQLAVNRFKWINLPEGVDERYLEWTLIRENVAVMFPLPKVPDRVFATKVMGIGPLNVYDNPTVFRSIGNNGWNVSLKNTNAVLIWNSMTRIPMWSTLEYFAKRMADIDRTADINLKNQKTPIIITGPEEKQNEITQFYAKMDGNEPAIFGLNSLNDMIQINVQQTNVPFIGIELQQMKRDIWNEMLEFLGIESANTQKRERLIEAEIEANTESTEMMRLDGLNARRQGAKKFNKMFGTNIDVVWRKDLNSDNYNYEHNLEKKETGGIDDEK
mgnify:CR=1 FL=1